MQGEREVGTAANIASFERDWLAATRARFDATAEIVDARWRAGAVRDTLPPGTWRPEPRKACCQSGYRKTAVTQVARAERGGGGTWGRHVARDGGKREGGMHFLSSGGARLFVAAVAGVCAAVAVEAKSVAILGTTAKLACALSAELKKEGMRVQAQGTVARTAATDALAEAAALSRLVRAASRGATNAHGSAKQAILAALSQHVENKINAQARLVHQEIATMDAAARVLTLEPARAAGKIDGCIQTFSSHKSQGAGGTTAKAYISQHGADVSSSAIAYNARATFTETYLPGCTKATYEPASNNEARRQKLASLLESAATLYAAGDALIDSSDVANGCMLPSGKHNGNNGVYKTQDNALAHGGVLGGMWKVTATSGRQELKVKKLTAWTPTGGDEQEDENDDPARLDTAIEEFDGMTNNSTGTVLQATKRLTQQMREKIAPQKKNQEDEETEETADVPAMDIEAWLAHLASAAPPNSTQTREDTQPKENPQRRISNEGSSGEKKDAHEGQKLLQQEGHTRAHAASRATKKISAAVLSLHAAAAGRS
ncbi:hypothetical protein ERJ75_000664400 [Trypanosoma vivax]|nr:hypothetical protein ERJ75_000664400 [Trypanosoma vivax]